MLLILLGAVVLSLVVWWLVQWARVKRFWADRGVPHNPPHPLLGSLTFLQRENPAHWLRRLYKEFKAPYVGIWVFWRPALVVNCPELARRVLLKDADNFRNRYLGSGKSDPIGAFNIFTADDPLWSSVRRRLTLVFTAAKLRSLQGLIRGKAVDLTERIQHEMTKDPNQFNLRVICTDYTTDVIGESAFGLKSEATRTGDSAMRKITKDFMEFSVVRGLSWSSIFFFPRLVDIFGFTMFPRKSVEYMRQVFRTIVAQRGGLDRDITETRDLLDALLKMRQDAAKEHEELSEDVLLAQAVVFLQGGFDTSGAALTFTIYELAHQPHLQDKLYQELVEAKERYGTEDLDSNQLAELPYLNAVTKETLRKYSPMGWLDRVASREYRVDDRLTIPAGTVVYVNAHGMHWDPDHFPDPDTYDPERFTPDNEKNIKPYTYMPFGEGPRSCIGMRFAQQTMRFALSAVMLRYSVRPAPGSVLPNHVHIENRGMFLVPDQKLSVIFTPRS